ARAAAHPEDRKRRSRHTDFRPRRERALPRRQPAARLSVPPATGHDHRVRGQVRPQRVPAGQGHPGAGDLSRERPHPHRGDLSSAAALAKTVFEPRVVETCAAAIRALDRRASGIFSTDLKENAASIPCITEINAGRFSSATNIFDFTGKHNMAVTYVRLARGEPPDMVGEYDVSEDYYMLRDIDASPRMFRAEEFFDAVAAAR